MESSHGEMKAWTCCPHVQRRRQEEGTSTPLSETQRGGGESPKEHPHVHTLVPKSTPHRCHSQATSPLPTQETLEGDSSSVTSAQLQKLGGSPWHISRTGMDKGGTAQVSQAGICCPMHSCPSLGHFWAFLCALGSHPRKKHKSHWRIPCGFCMLQTQCRFSTENCPSYRFKQL